MNKTTKKNLDLLRSHKKRPLLIAHRGLYSNRSSYFNLFPSEKKTFNLNENKIKTGPENSLNAFIAASKLGFGCEFDIQLTKDNKVICFHDDTLKRMCGVHKELRKLTYKQIQKYSLLNTKNKIPLLSDVLRVLNKNDTAIVELKHYKNNNWKKLCKYTLPLLNKYKNDGGKFVIESFYPKIVRWFRLNAPDIVRGQLGYAIKDGKNHGKTLLGVLYTTFLVNLYSRPNFCCWNYKSIHNPFLKLFRKMGGIIAGYSIDYAEQIKKFSKYYDCLIFENFIPKSPGISKHSNDKLKK